ncbi:Late secretory pathway protein AVL9 [Talaromyces islandicus]|uniref:Late secretory pathway protein AVL9 n=1 Tax=Talaromyces islandicus TaxID=28573 RepID=A0A0U1M2S8_TALIS|nr:Late secretory pathway protein AVL9 [Talaromyces islandicus]
MAEPIAHQDPIVLVIDFHHARGPEIELCFAEEGTNPAVDNDWSLLPFMALSDGAHASTEDFSYFTLRREATPTQKQATSLFGISCTRQIASNQLLNRSPDVTRSTVQKAVVVVTDRPQHFGTLREKLSMVTLAWFAQRDFSDIDILKKFRESLIASLLNDEAQKHAYLDCADPAFDSYSEKAEKPSSLKTSERNSLLAYMGLPLQIFGKGSMFGPYTPLQQLDLLADHGTKSYVVGSTNSLLLQQKDRYSDILINLDEGTVSVTSPSLRTALALTAADRRWIDFLVQTVNETWDESHPEQPKTHGYVGSEEFIRLQFEEYLLALLSCVNHREHVGPSVPARPSESAKDNKSRSTDNGDGDPTLEYSAEFITQWQTTPNHALFHRLTSDALLFSIVEPRHPCAGGLTIDDIQRRLAQQVSELHLDERVREGREALNKTFATGQKKVSSAFTNFWADIEAMREAQRKKNEERAAAAAAASDEKVSSNGEAGQSESSTSTPPATSSSSSSSSWFGARRAPSVDLTQTQASVNTAGQKAGAYFSSWGTWASERRKEWQDRRSGSSTTSSSQTAVPATTTTATTPPLTSPSTQTLPSVSETVVESDNISSNSGRRDSFQHQRKSEEVSTLARSVSRRKRWSSVLLKKDKDYETSSSSSSRRGSVDLQAAAVDSSLPKSPLAQAESLSTNDAETPLKSDAEKLPEPSLPVEDETVGKKQDEDDEEDAKDEKNSTEQVPENAQASEIPSEIPSETPSDKTLPDKTSETHTVHTTEE